MKRNITRAIIDATIDRGLREIYEDPRRSIRKFADLGHQLDKGRFTNNLYDVFQNLLHNDNSPYYTAIEHLLQHTGRKNLKDFGINLGYNGFTKGGKVIREYDENRNLLVPWGLIIRLDQTLKIGITPKDLIPIIAQGRSLGIYVYVIRLEKNLLYFEDLLQLFLTYDDCSFILVLPDEEIDTSFSALISSCTNVMYCLPAFENSCGHNAGILRRKEAWFSLYVNYAQEDIEETISEESTWEFMPQESSFLLLIADDEVSTDEIKKNSQIIKEIRLAPIAPLFIFDLYGDAMQIQKLISRKNYFAEILADGSFRTNTGVYKHDGGLINLETAFKNCIAEN